MSDELSDDGSERWINTDEAEDVAGSIRHANRCLALTCEDDQAWKWAALAIHSALQGACVCHLVTTASPVGVVREKDASKWLEYFKRSRDETDAKPPRTFILALPELLKAIREPYSAGDRSNSEGVRLSDDEFEWLERFHNQVRNQFVHFAPMGWSIEVSGIPDLAGLIARIITDILACGWAFRHQRDEWRSSLRSELCVLASAS